MEKNWEGHSREFTQKRESEYKENDGKTEFDQFLDTHFLDLWVRNNIMSENGKNRFGTEGKCLLADKIIRFLQDSIRDKFIEVANGNPRVIFDELEKARKQNYYYPIFRLSGRVERNKFVDIAMDWGHQSYADIPKEGGSIVSLCCYLKEDSNDNEYDFTEIGVLYSAALEAMLKIAEKESIPNLVMELKNKLDIEQEKRNKEVWEDDRANGYWTDGRGTTIFARSSDPELLEDHDFYYVPSVEERDKYMPPWEEMTRYEDRDKYEIFDDEEGESSDPDDYLSYLQEPEHLDRLKKEIDQSVNGEGVSYNEAKRLLEGDYFYSKVQDREVFYETFINNLDELDASDDTMRMAVSILMQDRSVVLENFKKFLSFFNKNPKIASEELLKERGSESFGPYKVLLNMIIYRLEFGQVDISEEGLEYLGKRLDLGEYNNANYFAHRGTADGKIFIFGQEDKELKSYVDFAAIDDDEQHTESLKVEMLSFAYDTLFVSRPDETEEEREQKMKFAEEFREKYFKVYLEELAGKVGISLNNFSIREQAWFLWYFESCDENRQSRVVDFLKKYGENGFSIFVLQEMDNHAGDKILAIGEKGNEEKVKKIFADVESIIRLSEITEKEIEKMFFKDDPGETIKKDKITQDILNRSLQVLDEYYNLIEQGEVSQQNLENKLQKNKKDLILFASIFKNAFAKGQEIDFSQIKGLDLSIMDSGELSDQDKKQMRDIFKGNRTGVSPEFAEQRLKGEFDPVMSESGHKFYTLKKDGQIISFARFDELENGNLYTGFINTAPDIKGMNIGSAFLETVFQREGQKKTIELKVREDNPAVKLYERFGFEVEGEPHEDPETKKVYFRMVRPPKAERFAEAA